MKVIHVIYSLEVGGAQRLLSEILPLTVNKGVDASVLVFYRLHNDFERKIENAGVEIISLNTKKKFSIKAFVALVRILKEWDIAHVHLFPAIYIISFLSIFLPSLKLVYTEHSTHNKRRDRRALRRIENLVYGRFDKIISISHQTQERLLKWLKSNNSKSQFVVVENGVNLIDYSIHSDRIDCIKERMILMISRFSDQKDQATLINALEYLKTPDVVVVFAGEGVNLDKCKNLAKKRGVCDRVRFLGNRNDIPELISKSYIGVQSSIWEGFGLTVVEFMAGGKPVIASNVDGLKQVVENAGILFEVGDYKGLANEVDLLFSDRSYYEMVSNKCLERSKKYDINNMVDKYIDVYYNLIN